MGTLCISSQLFVHPLLLHRKSKNKTTTKKNIRYQKCAYLCYHICQTYNFFRRHDSVVLCIYRYPGWLCICGNSPALLLFSSFLLDAV